MTKALRLNLIKETAAKLNKCWEQIEMLNNGTLESNDEYRARLELMSDNLMTELILLSKDSGLTMADVK